MNFTKTTPCNNCPYRKDAPLRHWAIEEFEQLLEHSRNVQYGNVEMGGVYECHKKIDHVCVGWLMKQVENDLPNIFLRVQLSINQVPREYLESLDCRSELYGSVEEMVAANFPELLND